MAADKKDKVLNFSSEREQSGACFSSAEREKNQGKDFLNVPNLRFPEFSGEWLECELQDIADISKGAGISKDQLSETGESCILYGELYTKYKSEVISNVVSKTDIENSNLVRSKANDVIIPSSGETAIDISTARCIPYDNILLGGDLNIIRLKDQDGRFFSYQLNGVRKLDIAQIAQGVSVVHLYGESLKRLKIRFPSKSEQERVSSLLSAIDERIEIQIRIIEDLEQLRSILNEKLIRHLNINEYKIEDVCSTIACKAYIKNKYLEHGEYPIIQQGEKPIIGYADGTPFCEYDKAVLFGDHTLSLYRPVSPFFIATDGIKVLITKENILRDYLYYAIATYMPKSEGYKRHYNILKDVFIPVPTWDEQEAIARHLSVYDEKIETEYKILHLYKMQKQYLLNHMFI